MSCTSVAGFATTSAMPWLPCSPIKHRKRPIPEPTAICTPLGRIFTMKVLKPTRLRIRKNRPEKKTAVSASCQGIPYWSTMVKVK